MFTQDLVTNGGTNSTDFDFTTMNSISTRTQTNGNLNYSTNLTRNPTSTQTNGNLNYSTNLMRNPTSTQTNANTKYRTKLASLSTTIEDSARGGASHSRGVSSFTSTVGTSQGTIKNNTLQTNEGAVSTTVIVVGVVVPVLVVAAVVSIILICVFRKRGNSKGTVRVWQIARTHTIPKPRQEASWYETEDGAEDNRAFNPDIELQPSNIFTNLDTFNNDEEIASEKNRSFSESYEGKETVVANTDNESINLKDYVIERDGDASITDLDPDIKEKRFDETATRVDALGTSVVTETNGRFQILEGIHGDYDLAGPTGDEDVKSEDGDIDTNVAIELVRSKEDKNKVITSEYEEDGQYVAMKLENDENDNAEKFGEIQLRHHELDQDDIYTNVDIRKVQSMQVMSYMHGENKPEENFPKRVASDHGMPSSRPPVAQPRLSKKKRLDPDDIPPGIPVRAPVNKTPRSSHTENSQITHGRQTIQEEQCSGDDIESETSRMTEKINEDISANISDMEEPNAEDIYDYPRTRSQVDEDDDSIYKVPPSRYP